MLCYFYMNIFFCNKGNMDWGYLLARIPNMYLSSVHSTQPSLHDFSSFTTAQYFIFNDEKEKLALAFAI